MIINLKKDVESALELYEKQKKQLDEFADSLNEQIATYNEARAQLEKMHNMMAQLGLVNKEFDR